MAADRGFGGAVAIERRGVDPVDAGVDRAPERDDAGHLVGLDEQAAGDAAAERDLGDFEAGAAEEVRVLDDDW